jgi:hypothetical protein
MINGMETIAHWSVTRIVPVSYAIISMENAPLAVYVAGRGATAHKVHLWTLCGTIYCKIMLISIACMIIGIVKFQIVLYFELECPEGSYGQNCSFTCSLCLEDKCDHVDGVCTIGCDDGYTGRMCDESMSLMVTS